MTHIAFEWN